MLNGFLAFLLGVAVQLAGGALGSLLPMLPAKNAPPPHTVVTLPASAGGQDDGPTTTVITTMGSAFDLCLGTDPQVLRQAAADALGLTLEQLAEEIVQGRTLAEVADAHGVSSETLIAALQAATQDSLQAVLDPLVAAGELTQAQADALLALQATRDLAPLLDLPFYFAVPTLLPGGEPGDWPDFSPMGPDGAFGFGEVPFALGGSGMSFRFQFEANGTPFTFELSTDTPAVRAALAQALGLTEDELAARIETGESLAAIAEAQGLDPQVLSDVWREAGLAQARAELDAAVAANTMTPTQAGDLLERIEQALSRSFMLPSRMPGGLRPSILFGTDGGFPFMFQEEVEKPKD